MLRYLFLQWGFRRCEDVCWVKTNKKNATPGLRHDSNTLFQRSKVSYSLSNGLINSLVAGFLLNHMFPLIQEHCLMGIKGTVRCSTDGHIIHANIDTDIIIAEEPIDGI